MKNVTQISESAQAIDELRAQVESISKAVEAIRKSGITEHALLALIVHSCPAYGPKYNRKRVTATMVKIVLSGMNNLQSFVFRGAAAERLRELAK